MNFNNIFIVTQYNQHIIITTCSQYKNMKIKKIFILGLWNSVYILYLQHISDCFATFQGLNGHTWLWLPIADSMSLDGDWEAWP